MRKLCVVVGLSLALASCGASSSVSDTTAVQTSTTQSADSANKFEYTITVGENTGSDVVIEVREGQTVTLSVVNPGSRDDVHLHEYDLSTGALEKGQVGTMTFTATKTGEFEIESHETQELLSTLRVVAR